MRAALIGLGMVSRTYADAFANSATVSLGSIYARTPESRAAFLARAPGLHPTAAASVAEIAADPAIDFVVLTTPPNARAAIVQTLVAAGKPILMEKPVERTLARATALVETCEAWWQTLWPCCPDLARWSPPRSTCLGGALRPIMMNRGAAAMAAMAAAC